MSIPFELYKGQTFVRVTADLSDFSGIPEMAFLLAAVAGVGAVRVIEFRIAYNLKLNISAECFYFFVDFPWAACATSSAEQQQDHNLITNAPELFAVA